MEKKISLDWNGSGLEFTGHSPNQVSFTIDGNAQTGPSPMIMMLHSLAACSAIDIVHILQKMRQPLESLHVEADARREPGVHARKWEAIHLRFEVGGPVSEDKARRSVELSVEKYCSAYRQLAPTAEITWEVKVG